MGNQKNFLRAKKRIENKKNKVGLFDNQCGRNFCHNHSNNCGCCSNHCQEPEPTPPHTPQTIRDVLLDNLNEQVQLTTPFDVVSGTLIDVENDYAVLVDNNGNLTLVRIDKIEFASIM